MAKNKKKKKGLGFKGAIISVLIIFSAALFLPTTAFLLFGMLPTMAAYFADRKGGWKAVTIGAMNMAGCTPFLLHLWTTENTVSYALSLITDPRTVIVIFSAASIGFLVEWAMSGIVVTVMTQRSKIRLSDMDKRRKNLIERWGEEVTGDMPLDEYGFPLEQKQPDEEKKPASK
jgi:ascorbate-specific PTS system EIIC-type component UlaA